MLNIREDETDMNVDETDVLHLDSIGKPQILENCAPERLRKQC